jgi:hypothetical protein
VIAVVEGIHHDIGKVPVVSFDIEFVREFTVFA